MPPLILFLWLVPSLPLLAAGWGALLKRERRGLAAGLSIGAMALSWLLSCAVFFSTLRVRFLRQSCNFTWFDLAHTTVQLGWMLDPLTAIILMMVTLLALLIFIYSLGYMARDENFTRFFCFMSLFGAGMLGIVIANSLLLLFICWELVGCPPTCSLVSGMKNRRRRRRQKRPSSPRALATSDSCSACSGFIPGAALCFFMTAARAALNKPRWTGWWPARRWAAWLSPLPSRF